LEYDAAGRLVSTIWQSFAETMSYDARGNLLTHTFGDGTFVRYSYNSRNELVRMQTPWSVSQYQYDSLGQLKSVTDGQDQQVTYEYDLNGWLIESRFPNGVVQERQYDPLGRLVLISDTYSALSEIQWEYEYDSFNRLVSQRDTQGNQIRYVYDLAGRLRSEDHSLNNLRMRLITYRYDSVGNRISMSDSVVGETDYEYDQNNRLVREQGPDGVFDYQYDARGNLTAKFNNQLPVLNYLWNSQNQLVSVDLDGDNIFDIDYLYDSRGQLIGRRDVDGVVLYLNAELDGLSQVLAEYRPDGTSIVEYQYGVERVSQTRQQETWYYHAGLLGSINRISDEQGFVSAEYRYDGFGNLLFSNASVENSFFFSGERRDVTVGLDYLRARFLDTRVGRFVSSDPFPFALTDPATLHRYAYAHGDPINYQDPTGLFGLSDLSAVQSILGSLWQSTSVFRTIAAVRERAQGVEQLVFFVSAAAHWMAFNMVDHQFADEYGTSLPGKVSLGFDVKSRNKNLPVNQISLKASSASKIDVSLSLKKVDEFTPKVKFSICAGSGICGGGIGFDISLYEVPDSGDFKGNLLKLTAGVTSSVSSPKDNTTSLFDLALNFELTLFSTLKYQLTFFSLDAIMRRLPK
jgi:RHS repeat-associated protein